MASTRLVAVQGAPIEDKLADNLGEIRARLAQLCDMEGRYEG